MVLFEVAIAVVAAAESVRVSKMFCVDSKRCYLKFYIGEVSLPYSMILADSIC